MKNYKVLDDDLDFKKFIDGLGFNIITGGTGIGKYKKQYYIYANRIKGQLSPVGREGNLFFGLYYIPTKREKVLPNRLLNELSKHEEIPCDKVSDLVIGGCILNMETMMLINKVLPNLKAITVVNSTIERDSFFNIIENVMHIRIEKSTINNMRVFNGIKEGYVGIIKSKVKEITKEHITCNAKAFRIEECNLNMPMFLINTDMPHCVDFYVDNKEVMNDLDISFLSFYNLEELYFNATITDVAFLSKFMNLATLEGLFIDLSQNKEMLLQLKERLKARIKYLKTSGEYRYKDVIKSLIERYTHIAEEGYNSLINGRELAYFNFILSDDTKRFYKNIKVEYDPLDLNNWINKSKSEDIEKIVRELMLIRGMPYHLRQQIGTIANQIIKIPNQNEFLDILNEVRKKAEERNWNTPTRLLYIKGKSVYDMYGNPLIDNEYEKHIYSSTYDVLSSFERETEYKKETVIRKIIETYSPTKCNVIGYLFDEFRIELENSASDTIGTIKSFHNKPTGDTCPECGKPIVYKYGKYGLFKSCKDVKDCKYVESILTGEACPECGKPLIVRVGRFGTFVGCMDYPNCKYTKNEDTESKIKRGNIEEKELNKLLVNNYVNEVLEDLYKYKDIALNFEPADYVKIKDSLPDIYSDFIFGEFEKLIYICTVYKHITGEFPPIIREKFAKIEVPEDVIKEDQQDHIIEVVIENEEEKYEVVKKNTYKKVRKYKYLGDSD